MRAPLVVFAALFSQSFLGGCAAVGAPVAGPTDVARASSRWPGVTSAELERGRVLFESRCASCHQLVAPHRIPAEQWPREIAEMKARAGLDDQQAVLVERYVVTMSDAKVGK